MRIRMWLGVMTAVLALAAFGAGSASAGKTKCFGDEVPITCPSHGHAGKGGHGEFG
jgi:hypothetical protein